MNDNATRNPSVLPELSDDTIARVEERVFLQIDEERTRTKTQSRGRRKRTAVLGWSAAAAVAVVAGAVVVPSLLQSSVETAADTAQNGGSQPLAPAAGDADTMSRTESYEIAPVDGGAAPDQMSDQPVAVGKVGPEIITTSDVSITVTDVSKSAEAVLALATDLKGFVSDQSLGTGNYGYVEDGAKEVAGTSTPTYGWVTIRVPAESVDDALTKLGDLGTVTSTSTNRADVTQQAVDLRARVSSLQTSVARLEELMTQSASVADLVTAESALAERQAELESLQSQLDALNDQVALSTVTVNLQAKSVPVDANPDGFGDGISNGWNALIAALNGFIIFLGFALPWLAVLVVAALVIWGIVRGVRGSKGARGARVSREVRDEVSAP